MTTKDLMIGDYVTFADCQNDDAPSIVKIEGLGYQGRGVVEEALITVDGDEHGFDLAEIDDEFVGIPLKVDMLKEWGLGYEESDSELTHLYLGEPHFCKDMGLHIGTDRKGHFWLNYHNNSIYGLRYVHELQHAFRLLGIEIEIVL
jgi:hypothetical protein